MKNDGTKAQRINRSRTHPILQRSITRLPASASPADIATILYWNLSAPLRFALRHWTLDFGPWTSHPGQTQSSPVQVKIYEKNRAPAHPSHFAPSPFPLRP